MITKKWNKSLIFSYDNKSSYIIEYDSEYHYLIRRQKVEDKEIGDILSINDDECVVLLGNDLVKYSVENNAFGTRKTDYSPDVIRYNSYDNSLWCAKGNVITVLNAIDFKEIQQIELEETVLSLELFGQ